MASSTPFSALTLARPSPSDSAAPAAGRTILRDAVLDHAGACRNDVLVILRPLVQPRTSADFLPGRLEFTITGAAIGGAGGLFDADGASLVIHAGPDDYRTDPSGNSGARIACGVLRAS